MNRRWVIFLVWILLCLNVKTGHGNDWKELLALAGWDAERLDQFEDDAPLNESERQSLLQLLYRLRSFDTRSLARMAHSDRSLREVLSEPESQRGTLFALQGKVRHIERHNLSEEEAARLEMPAYFECQMVVESADEPAKVMTLVTATVPRVWESLEKLDEPVRAVGLLVKRLTPPDSEPKNLETQHESEAIFLCKRIAWYPAAVRPPLVPYDHVVLGSLGTDVSLLDGIQNRKKILPTEREAFYQLLHAVRQVGANQLIRFAEGNFEVVRATWDAKKQALPETTARALLAKQVLQQMSTGRYSVAPLFNDADGQIGRLVSVDGTLRRAVRIEVGTSPDGQPSDVWKRFGIGHYFELEIFTDDSQNYPLIFCVRQLPAGLSAGESMHEPVRVAGFFFKSWLFHSRQAAKTGGSMRALHVPLLIGPGPVRLLTDQGGASWYGGLLGGGLFVLAMLGIWAIAWWFAHADRQWKQRIREAEDAQPDGQSLNDLDLHLSDQGLE